MSKEPTGWQPIETAAKNYASVLLWFPWPGVPNGQLPAEPEGCMMIGIWAWQDDTECFAWRDTGDYRELGDPTHWMPLPEPPHA